MGIVDKYSHDFANDDYLKLCNGLKELYLNKKYPVVTISCRLVFTENGLEWKDLLKYCTDTDELVNFIEEELNAPFIDAYTIKEQASTDEYHTRAETCMTFKASTLKEHMQNVLEFEKVNRPQRIWFGSVDQSHVHYEGLRENDDGSFSIVWGS